MVVFSAYNKGYKIWFQNLDKFVISRDVKFFEEGDRNSSI